MHFTFHSASQPYKVGILIHPEQGLTHDTWQVLIKIHTCTHIHVCVCIYIYVYVRI